MRKVAASTGGSRNVSGLTFPRLLFRAKTLSQACSEGRRGEGGEGGRSRPRLENFSNSLSENNICAGAFDCAFTVYVERHVDFHLEIIAFVLSEGKVT